MSIDSLWPPSEDTVSVPPQKVFSRQSLTTKPTVFSVIQATLSRDLLAALPCSEMITLQCTVESHQLQLVHDADAELYHIVGCDASQFSRLQDALFNMVNEHNKCHVKPSQLSNLPLAVDVHTIRSTNLPSLNTSPVAKRKRGRPRKVSSPPVSDVEYLPHEKVKLEDIESFKVPFSVQCVQKRIRSLLAVTHDNTELDELVAQKMNYLSKDSNIDRTVILASTRLRTQDLPPSVHRGRTRLARHEYETLAPYRFFCTVCSFRSKRVSHLHKHMLLHDGAHAVRVLQCPSCPYRTTRANHLSMHRHQHRSGALLRCDRDGCAYRTDNAKHLARHKTIKHCALKVKAPRNKILKCHISNCNYETERPYLMQRHTAKHRRIIISTRNSVSRVPTDKTQEGVEKGEEFVERYSCEQCPYTTSVHGHFVRHSLVVHSDSKPFLCEHCGRSFKRSQSLAQHILMHSCAPDGKQYTHSCSTCGKKFRVLGHLREHVATHSAEREHLCEHCGAAFKTKMVRRKHVQTIHDNPRAYGCTKCDKKFNTRYALQRHAALHDVLDHRETVLTSSSGGSAVLVTSASDVIRHTSSSIVDQEDVLTEEITMHAVIQQSDPVGEVGLLNDDNVHFVREFPHHQYGELQDAECVDSLQRPGSITLMLPSDPTPSPPMLTSV